MTILLVIVGWVDLASTTVLAGGYISAALIATPSGAGRRAIQWAGGVLASALLAELVITGFRMAAISSAYGLTFVGEIWGMHWCRLWLLRCAGLALLLRLRLGSRPAAGLAALWVSLRSFQGHAGAHGTVPAIVDWIHLLAAVSWLGSLFQLATIRSAPAPLIAERVRRLATIAVAALLPCGLWGAWLHIPNADQLVNSPYGATLLVKLTLAAGLLFLGATNHFRHVPAALRDGDGATQQRFRRVVRWEIVIAALVILASALLGILPTPHQLLQ